MRAKASSPSAGTEATRRALDATLPSRSRSRFGRAAAAAAVLALASCSPLGSVERDRAADLTAIAARPVPERARLLRERVLRDGVTVGARFPAQQSDGERLRIVAPGLLADDYVLLGDALRESGDADAALGAYEDALAAAAKVSGGWEPQSRVRVRALLGEEALWRSRSERARAEAARVLSVCEQRPLPESERVPCAVVGLQGLPAAPELALLRGLEQLPLPAAGSGGGAPQVLTILDSLRRGAPLIDVRRALDAAIGARAAAAPASSPPYAPPDQPSPAPPQAAPVDTSALPLPLAEAAPPPPSPSPSPPGKADAATRLKQLDQLRSQKLITDKEYNRERARILKESL